MVFKSTEPSLFKYTQETEKISSIQQNVQKADSRGEMGYFPQLHILANTMRFIWGIWGAEGNTSFCSPSYVSLCNKYL